MNVSIVSITVSLRDREQISPPGNGDNAVVSSAWTPCPLPSPCSVQDPPVTCSCSTLSLSLFLSRLLSIDLRAVTPTQHRIFHDNRALATFPRDNTCFSPLMPRRASKNVIDTSSFYGDDTALIITNCWKHDEIICQRQQQRRQRRRRRSRERVSRVAQWQLNEVPAALFEATPAPSTASTRGACTRKIEQAAGTTAATAGLSPQRRPLTTRDEGDDQVTFARSPSRVSSSRPCEQPRGSHVGAARRVRWSKTRTMWARAAGRGFFGVPLSADGTRLPRRPRFPPLVLECSQPLASLVPRGYADPARPTSPDYRPSAPASAGRLAHSSPRTAYSELASTSVTRLPSVIRLFPWRALILRTRSRRRNDADKAPPRLNWVSTTRSVVQRRKRATRRACALGERSERASERPSDRTPRYIGGLATGQRMTSRYSRREGAPLRGWAGGNEGCWATARPAAPPPPPLLAKSTDPPSPSLPLSIYLSIYLSFPPSIAFFFSLLSLSFSLLNFPLSVPPSPHTSISPVLSLSLSVSLLGAVTGSSDGSVLVLFFSFVVAAPFSSLPLSVSPSCKGCTLADRVPRSIYYGETRRSMLSRRGINVVGPPRRPRLPRNDVWLRNCVTGSWNDPPRSSGEMTVVRIVIELEQTPFGSVGIKSTQVIRVCNDF